MRITKASLQAEVENYKSRNLELRNFKSGILNILPDRSSNYNDRSSLTEEQRIFSRIGELLAIETSFRMIEGSKNRQIDDMQHLLRILSKDPTLKMKVETDEQRYMKFRNNL